MKRQMRIGITLIVGLLCLLPLATAVILCIYEVERNLEIEMSNTLRDVAEQNNVAVEKEIEERFGILYTLADKIEQEADVQLVIDGVQHLKENYCFTQIGYLYPDGSAYSTDGEVEKVAESARQFRVPVYEDENGQQEMGVLYATYPKEWLEEVLNAKAFAGKGYGCIVMEDGTVIAHSMGSPIYEKENFLTCFDENPEAVEVFRETFRKRFHASRSGLDSFWLNGEQMFFYTPLELDNGQLQWYMITVVPKAVLAERIQPIKGIINRMFIIMAIILVGSIIIFCMTYYVRKKELLDLAYTDPLTQGYNYAYFRKIMKKKRGICGYILAMDINGFKIINNTCGVATGDEVLAGVWRALHKNLREGELAARLYADRFIVFLAEEDRERLQERLEKLVTAIERISMELNTPQVIPVIGVYKTEMEQPVETAYGNAVIAKHLVKGRRDRKYAFYEEVDHAGVMERRVIEDGFEQAILDKQFEIWYQPKYHAASGVLSGAEALVRWRKSDGTLMPPIKFIPIYEKNGMIPRLDEYIFRMVCAQQKKWLEDGKQIRPVSVNISRVSLYYLNLVEKYKTIVDEYELETQHIQLEITESATIGNDEAASLIEQFHRAGFKMLLDDFGSGYSSLSTLNMMHFDIMKLDKSLIDYIGDENGEKLLHYITKLGQNLGLEITAEGVETKEQVEFLQKLHCDEIQGYYFSKPLQAEEFGKLLNT